MSSIGPRLSARSLPTQSAGASKSRRYQATPSKVSKPGTPDCSHALGTAMSFHSLTSVPGFSQLAAVPGSLALYQVASWLAYSSSGTLRAATTCATRSLKSGSPARPRLAGPGLGDGAAPRGVDQADRHLQLAVELTTEEVARGAEAAPQALGHGVGVAGQPRQVGGVGRLLGDLARHGQQADVGVFGLLDLVIVVAGADAHLHVRLAGADPHVAHQDVGDRHGDRTGDRHGVGTAGRERADLHRPTPIGRGGGRALRTVHRHRDHAAGRRPAPHRHRHVALQHGVVAEQRVQEGAVVLVLDRAEAGGERGGEGEQGQERGAETWT